tara:strand:- start:7782 stop:7925 length:144 start_codon:yes stop_codon:yes gene_type:complete
MKLKPENYRSCITCKRKVINTSISPWIKNCARCARKKKEEIKRLKNE